MIEIKNLYKSFGDKQIFENFNLTIDTGNYVVIMGPSGSGKTTLLNIIGGLEPFDSGSIIIDGVNIKSDKDKLNCYKNKLGFIFQNFVLVDGKTVKENLEMVNKKIRTEIGIDEALEKLGILSLKNKKIYQLSGGEQQRVALARLLIKKCEIVLADEPTGSLDKANAQIVLNHLKSINEMGKTVIVVTHDPTIKKYGNQIVEL